MTDIGSTSNSRIQPRPGSGMAQGLAPGRGGRAGAKGSGGAPDGSAELEGALQRLRTLLAFDGDGGPRQDVRMRGFYLNILV